MKIEILSPIHIGTGEMVNNVCYRQISAAKVGCYDYGQIMSTISPKDMLDERLLNALSIKNNSRQSINSLQNKADFSRLTPKYELKNKEDLNNYDSFELTKTSGKPYIPGSSIKGAIMHAILYRYIKENFNSIDMERLLGTAGKRNTIKDIVSALTNDKNFYAAFSKCIICRDLYFEKMLLIIGERIHPDIDMKLQINCEAIEEGQTCEGELFSIIDERQKEIYLRDFATSERCRKFIDLLKTEKILEAIGITFEDNIAVELDANAYYDADIEELEKIKEKSKDFYILRIGRFTTYFEKSIVYLIKKNCINLYKKYFERVLKPAKKTNAKSIPKTRMVFFDENDASYIMGYIGIRK